MITPGEASRNLSMTFHGDNPAAVSSDVTFSLAIEGQAVAATVRRDGRRVITAAAQSKRGETAEGERHARRGDLDDPAHEQGTDRCAAEPGHLVECHDPSLHRRFGGCFTTTVFKDWKDADAKPNAMLTATNGQKPGVIDNARHAAPNPASAIARVRFGCGLTPAM